MSAVPKPEVRLSTIEIENILKTFTPADWSRAKNIAAAAGAGLIGWAPDDLLQEAITKLLDGSRTCPVGVHPLVMLKTAMRSIASNVRKRHLTSPIDDDVAVAHFDGNDEADTRLSVRGDAVSCPEQGAAAREALSVIDDLVSGDENLAMLAIAWADGLRGKDAADALDWDWKTYEAARKRFTRRLSALSAEWSIR